MSLGDLTRNTQGVASPLTADDLQRAADRVRSQPPSPPHRHLVSPAARHTPGTYTCIECGAPVEVTVPLSELH